MKIGFIRKKHEKLAKSFHLCIEKFLTTFFTSDGSVVVVFSKWFPIIKKYLVDIANGIFYTLPTPKLLIVQWTYPPAMLKLSISYNTSWVL